MLHVPPGVKSTRMVARKMPLPVDRLLLASATIVDRIIWHEGSEGSTPGGSTHVTDVKSRLATARWSCRVPVPARAGEAVIAPPSMLSSALSATITPVRLMAIPPPCHRTVARCRAWRQAAGQAAVAMADLACVTSGSAQTQYRVTL